MTAILMDLETGEPYLDEKNNVVYVDNRRGFEQIIDGLFHCDVGSEVMNPGYGFDLKSALTETGSLEETELFIETLVIQALNPQYEKLINKIDYVKAERDENGDMDVVIAVTSILDDQITTELTIGSIV